MNMDAVRFRDVIKKRFVSAMVSSENFCITTKHLTEL